MKSRFAVILFGILLGTFAGRDVQAAPGGTLLVYDSLSKPFSMEDEVEPVAILLSRFEPVIHRREARALTPADVESADRIVVVGTGGFPAMPADSLAVLKSTKKPLMAVGGAASLALGVVPTKRVRSESPGECEIRYLGSRWPALVDPLFPVEVDASRVLGAVIAGSREMPLCFREGKRFGFAALPAEPPLSLVFSDVLMDFYGVGESSPPALLFLVDDFHPGCSAASLRRLVDYFSHLGISFAVGAQMNRMPEGVEAMPREEYFDALRYAQTHGGRIFLNGREEMDSAAKYEQEGLKPVGPANPAELDPAAIQIGRLFYRKIPGSDAVPLFLGAPMRLAGGGWLWPANVRGGLDGEHLDAVRSQVRRIVSFRGGVAGLVVPAWLPFQSMRDLVDAAREVQASVADPLESVPKSF